MRALPVFDLASASPPDVRAALQGFGAMLVRDPRVPASRCLEAIADAAAFFARPQLEKDALAIAHSPHFRGYSQMHNERDWREQIHFGREVAGGAGGEQFGCLEGPNLWPGDVAWRERMLAYLAAVEGLGQRVLSLIAESLGLPAQAFASEHEPYLLMKLICYHAQPETQPPRQVAGAPLERRASTIPASIASTPESSGIRCAVNGSATANQRRLNRDRQSLELRVVEMTSPPGI